MDIETSLPVAGIQAGANRKTQLLVACIAAYCFGNLTQWLLPEWLSDSMEVLKLSATQGSIACAAETVALAVTSIFLASRESRLTYFQVAIIGAVVALIGNGASGLVSSYPPLILSRFVAGVGEGAVLMVGTALVADFKNPDAVYAKLNIANIVYGSAAFFSLPLLFPSRNGLMIFLIATCALIPLLAGFGWISRRSITKGHEFGVASKTGIFAPPALALYGGMLFLATATSGNWSFLVEYGKRTGMAQEQIDMAIGIATISAVIGSGLVALIGDRFGRLIPALACMAIAGFFNFDIVNNSSPLWFRIDCAFVLIGVYFLVPYFLGYGAALDASGRISAIVNAAFMLSLASGPVMSGAVNDYYGAAVVPYIVLGLFAVSALLLVFVDRCVKKIL